ncbi:MAG: RagB/SusD family nutrient uptake outer membrane protein, partial [Paramuribaculum sp.]|nr:RagB/SusD family nutrient uptake outer membrane protein [Paramuribaculum sp.]
MKFYNKAIFPAVALAMVCATSCNDLDTLPQGQYITSEQKGEAIEANPELAKSGVIAISSNFIPFCQTYTTEQHNDFGWPASMIYLDHHASDMVGLNLGYNWFIEACEMSGIKSNGQCTAISWYTLYRQIDSANAVLENIDSETTDSQLMFFRSQALAMRANAYFILAQMYQHTYKGHESMPCVPIIDLENRATAAVDGAARKTVQEVYDFIINDINNAIDDLRNCGITPAGVIDSGAKRLVSLGTALGIRARVNLVMQNWAAAAQDAREAISVSGATPYSIEEVSHPTFQKMTEHAWMWG